MEKLLTDVAMQIPGLAVLVGLSIVWIRALKEQRNQFADTLGKVQIRQEQQMDKAWQSVEKIQVGCANHTERLQESLGENTSAVRDLKEELRFFRPGNPERGGTP